MKTYVYFFLSLLVTAGAIFYAEKTSPSSLGVFYSFSMSKAFVPVGDVSMINSLLGGRQLVHCLFPFHFNNIQKHLHWKD